MTAPKIEPALTEKELASGVDIYDAEANVPLEAVLREDGLYVDCDDGYYSVGPLPPSQIGKLMAIANAALPDSDPRKITREIVAWLGDLAWYVRDQFPSSYADQFEPFVRRLAAALESYLPPEKP